MPATATRLLTATEAQIRSGRSMVRFRQWVAAGRLRFVVDEFGRRRFDVEDVDRLVAEVARYQLQETQPIAEAPAPSAESDHAEPAGVTSQDIRRLLGLSPKEA